MVHSLHQIRVGLGLIFFLPKTKNKYDVSFSQLLYMATGRGFVSIKYTIDQFFALNIFYNFFQEFKHLRIFQCDGINSHKIFMFREEF